MILPITEIFLRGIIVLIITEFVITKIDIVTIENPKKGIQNYRFDSANYSPYIKIPTTVTSRLIRTPIIISIISTLL
jgi:hypothetical protein